jgi:4-hydroxyphenylpyruvate dioxygenase
MTGSNAGERKLVGFANFKRSNPRSDKFDIQRFHHIEFFTLDATSLCKRWDILFLACYAV